MEYIRVESEFDCLKADKLFNELIKYESKLDFIINGECLIDGFHKQMLDKSHTFICFCKENDIAIGYVFAYLKTPSNKVIKTNVIDVEALFINEEYRKKGVGKELLNRVDLWAKDTFSDYVIEITCLTNNENALKFYQSVGYKPVKMILRK